MKKYIFILLFIGSLSINAQTVNDIKIEEIPARYVQIIVEAKGMSPFKVNVYLDYGQMDKDRDKKGFIIDSDGERMIFKSPINAINYLDNKGFKLISNYINYDNYYSILFENENYKKTN